MRPELETVLESTELTRMKPDLNNGCAESGGLAMESPYTSVLTHLHSYRFSKNLELFNRKSSLELDTTNSAYANNVNPQKFICQYDLLGKCHDAKCRMQHKKSYMLDSTEKMFDVLLYNPGVAGIDRTEITASTEVRQRLLQFAKSLGEDDVNLSNEQLIKLVRGSMKRGELTDFTRSMVRFPKYNKFTYHDYKYDIKVRDRSLVLTHGKVAKLLEEADNDAHMRSRFYPTVSADLEGILAKDSKQALLWIKLAYHHFVQEGSKTSRISKALNILARGLEANERNSDLWEHYIFFYANMTFDENSKMPELLQVCRTAAERCRSYRSWKCYLKYATTVTDKLVFSKALIKGLSTGTIIPDPDTSTSSCLLEAITYRIRLLIQTGQLPRAKTFLRSILTSDDALKPKYASVLGVLKYVSDTDVLSVFHGIWVTEMRNSCILKLDVEDRVFIWLCYVNLLVNDDLPSSSFELFSQGFSGLRSAKSMLLKWKEFGSSSLYAELLPVFGSAFISCFQSGESDASKKYAACAPLFINLLALELYFMRSDKNLLPLFNELLKSHWLLELDNSQFIWFMFIEPKITSATLEKIFATVFPTVKKKGSEDRNMNFFAALLSFVIQDRATFRFTCLKVIKPYIDGNLPLEKLNNLRELYSAVVCDIGAPSADILEIRRKLDFKYPVRSAKLWLCYM